MISPCVTVSLVSHGHGDDIPLLLSDLVAFASLEIAEVVVTLNIPEAALVEWVESRSWPFKVSLLRNSEPLGYGANQNQAFSQCQTPFFCVVNPDIRLSQDPFPSLLAALDAPSAGCAYPMQSDGRGCPRDQAREVPTPFALLRRYLVPGCRAKPQPRHWVNGAFMLFPSAVFAQIGGFDIRYFMYCEDVDVCLRLQLQGYSLLPAVGASVEHIAQRASRRQLRHFAWHVRSLWVLWHSTSYSAFLDAAVPKLPPTAGQRI